MDCEIVAGGERSVLLDSGGFAEQKDCRCRFVTIAQGANDSHMGGSQEGEIKNPSKKVGENHLVPRELRLAVTTADYGKV